MRNKKFREIVVYCIVVFFSLGIIPLLDVLGYIKCNTLSVFVAGTPFMILLVLYVTLYCLTLEKETLIKNILLNNTIVWLLIYVPIVLAIVCANHAYYIIFFEGLFCFVEKGKGDYSL